MELSEFDIELQPQTTIKAQVVADFIAEFTNNSRGTSMEEEIGNMATWILYVDGSSNAQKERRRDHLNEPKGRRIPYVLRFDFKSSNNEAEYKVVTVGMNIAKNLGVRKLKIKSDSQLIVNQVNEIYQLKSKNMQAYLDKVKEVAKLSDIVEIEHVPQEQNSMGDAFAKLATIMGTRSFGPVLVEHLKQPSTTTTKVETIDETKSGNKWMDDIRNYLQKGKFPKDNLEAKKLRYRATQYTIIDGTLYRRGFSLPYLKCLGTEEGGYVFREIHKGICGTILVVNSWHEKYCDRDIIGPR